VVTEVDAIVEGHQEGVRIQFPDDPSCECVIYLVGESDKKHEGGDGYASSKRIRFYSKAYHANHYEIRESTFVGTRSQQLYKRNSDDVVKDLEGSFRTSNVIATAIKMSARALGNDHRYRAVLETAYFPTTTDLKPPHAAPIDWETAVTAIIKQNHDRRFSVQIR
jgi:hypothetical protein